MPPKKPKLLPVPTSPADIAMLLHEAVVHGFVRGIDGITERDVLVVGRRRPFIPCGEDPALVNAECARRYAVDAVGFTVREIDPADVVPFVDRAAELVAADERANAAQRGNIKPEETK